MPQRKCPYDECLAKGSVGNYYAQTVFIVVAFFVLIGSKDDFTPLSVILYAVPPVIELVCKKCIFRVQKLIKYVLVIYTLAVVIISVLLIEGTLIYDNAYYRMCLDAVAFKSFSVNVDVFATSLIIIAFVPIFLRFSLGEKKDKGVINGQTGVERKGKVSC